MKKLEAKFQLNKEIVFYVNDSIDVIDGNSIELPNSKCSDYSLFAKGNLNDSQLNANCLCMEKEFGDQLEEDEISQFHDQARVVLLEYLEKLKYVSLQHLIKLEDDGYVYELGSNTLLKSPPSTFILDMVADSVFQPINQKVHHKIIIKSNPIFNEVIKRHNAISSFNDPVLKLISFAGLYEYLIKSVGRVSQNLKAKMDQNQKVSMNQYYSFAKATRNLVAHGVVDLESSLKYLNKPKMLNTPNAKLHEFSRDNREHMILVGRAIIYYDNLVRECIDLLL